MSDSQVDIARLKKDGLGVSLSADIWGENGISLLGVMGHWIDENWEMKEKLLLCEPFGEVRHTSHIVCIDCTCLPAECVSLHWN